MNKEFWKDKRVLLTGHTGFKGGWASLWLHRLGAKVYGYALPAPTDPSFYEAVDVRSYLVDELIADVCDYEKLSDFLLKSGANIILHMAAQPLVRLSYDQPIETYATNVMGTVHVLNAARFSKSVRSIIIVTTDKCYENVEKDEGYSESEPMGGYDPYSSSKGCAELVTAAMRKSFYDTSKVGVATARAGNVIGGGDWARDRIIPDIFRAFETKRNPLIRNPNAIRPWQHVMEPISGYLLLAEKLYSEPDKYSEAWNFGPDEGDAKDVRYIADRFSNSWGDGVFWDYDKSAHPHEAKFLKLKIDKAMARLNWQPRLSVDEAIDMTVNWYKGYSSSKGSTALYDLCISQIIDYETKWFKS